MRSPLLLRLALLALAAGACTTPDPPAITAAWRDDFNRSGGVGGDYRATADAYRIEGGRLRVQGARNHPLWLRRKLPRDAVIELDCGSDSPDGDIKLELWGDGSSYDPSAGAYTASSYVLVFGGWRNSKSIIARQDEHAPGIPTRTTPRVEPGRAYHWKIVRKGGKLDWFIDDLATPFLSLDDPQPLAGPGHEYLAFDNWETPVWYDALSVTPL